jgi:hypothetical protein
MASLSLAARPLFDASLASSASTSRSGAQPTPAPVDAASVAVAIFDSAWLRHDRASVAAHSDNSLSSDLYTPVATQTLHALKF